MHSSLYVCWSHIRTTRSIFSGIFLKPSSWCAIKNITCGLTRNASTLVTRNLPINLYIIRSCLNIRGQKAPLNVYQSGRRAHHNDDPVCSFESLSWFPRREFMRIFVEICDIVYGVARYRMFARSFNNSHVVAQLVDWPLPSWVFPSTSTCTILMASCRH